MLQQNTLLVNGHSLVSSSLETIYPGSGDYIYLTRDEPLGIVSDSDQDKRGGTGAFTVNITGLNHKYELISEDLDLRGITKALSLNAYLRVLDITVTKSSTPAGLAGVLTVSGDISSTVLGKVENTTNRMMNGIFTVPAEHNGFIIQYAFSATVPPEKIISGIKYKLYDLYEESNWVTNPVDFTYSGKISRDLGLPFMFPEKTDVEFTGSKASGGVLAGFFNIGASDVTVSSQVMFMREDASELPGRHINDMLYDFLRGANYKSSILFRM